MKWQGVAVDPECKGRFMAGETVVKYILPLSPETPDPPDGHLLSNLQLEKYPRVAVLNHDVKTWSCPPAVTPLRQQPNSWLGFHWRHLSFGIRDPSENWMNGVDLCLHPEEFTGPHSFACSVRMFLDPPPDANPSFRALAADSESAGSLPFPLSLSEGNIGEPGV